MTGEYEFTRFLGPQREDDHIEQHPDHPVRRTAHDQRLWTALVEGVPVAYGCAPSNWSARMAASLTQAVAMGWLATPDDLMNFAMNECRAKRGAEA